MAAKYKVLALHGYTQSGPSFAKKAGALRKSLKPLGVELTFPTAPREIRPADVSDPSERAKLQEIEEQGEEWQNFGWCVRDDDGKDMKDLDKSVEFIGKVMETEGPFVGILGFSQGAAVAATIASMLEKGSTQTMFPRINHPPVNFFIAVCGFRWEFKQYDQFYPIHTPSLHVVGTADTIVSEERSTRLMLSCTNPEVVTHPGGHFLPSAANRKHEMVAFIKKHLPKETELNGQPNGVLTGERL